MKTQILSSLFLAMPAAIMANYSESRSHSSPSPSKGHSSIASPKLRFGHVGLSVANLTLETAWYRRVLGFDHVDTEILGSNLTTQVIILKNAADVRVEFRLQEDSTPNDRNPTNINDLGAVRGLLNWSLQVDDVDSLYRDMVADGVDSFQEPIDTPTGDRFCMIRDPEGNIIELIQHAQN